MALAAGTRLGPYVIDASVGAGGMGEVYRARDSRLRRDVAIKILTPLLARDPDRLARFEREAQMLASLNHPNIAAIHGIEDVEGTPALVLEFVEGDTLAERLARGPVPIEDAIGIAKQIAAALEAAHDRGVVHRDLKPANIKLTPGGIVKVLDFGLAKALEPASIAADPASSPTFTRVTELGVILGTAAYMAPEQARGKPVDRRADIWSFGVVLYEMLTGARAFAGDSVTDVLAAVVSRDPEWAGLPAATPPALRRLLRRTLQKDPARRLHHVADARLDLDEAGEAPEPPAPPPAPRRSPRLLPLAAIGIGLVATGFVLRGLWTPRPPRSPEWYAERLGGSTIAFGPHASPDGQMVAFQALIDGMSQVGVIRPSSGGSAILTHERTRGLISEMSWSRDSSLVYFDRQHPRGIYSVPVIGGDGSERLVLEDSWSPVSVGDGTLIVARTNAEGRIQFHHLWPDSGRLEPLPALAAPESRLPAPTLRVFPGGREAVYVGKPAGSTDPDHLYVLDFASGRSRRIAAGEPLVFERFTFPLAVSADGESVLFVVPSGNLRRLVAAPRDGSAGVRTVLTLTSRPLLIDVAGDGSVYVDQTESPSELLRFSPGAKDADRTLLPATHDDGPAVPLADGRTLVATRSGGRDRIVVIAPGKDPVAFIDTEEDTTWPIAALGQDKVLLLVGRPPQRSVAVVATATGRVLKRLTGIDGNRLLGGLAGSPDGKTIFFVTDGTLQSVTADDGPVRKVGPADCLAVDPSGRELLIALRDAKGLRLIRRSLEGAPDRDVALPGEFGLTSWCVTANAIGRDGRIALRVDLKDSWFWPAVVFDPTTGLVERVPGGDRADMLFPGWDREGRLITVSQEMRGSLWRFRVRQ